MYLFYGFPRTRMMLVVVESTVSGMLPLRSNRETKVTGLINEIFG